MRERTGPKVKEGLTSCTQWRERTEEFGRAADREEMPRMGSQRAGDLMRRKEGGGALLRANAMNVGKVEADKRGQLGCQNVITC